VGRRRLGSLVWLGMILAGSCLAAVVVFAWPESTTYTTRLPHGESRPKTPNAAAKPQAPVERVVASADVVAPAQTEIAPDEETVKRELAGPPPVSSEAESEQDDGYRPETPEELGAKPLPGMDPDAATP